MATEPQRAQAEALVATVLGTFRERFPHKTWSCYIQGSYADGTATRISDLDMILVADTSIDDTERTQIAELVTAWRQQFLVRLDLVVLLLDDLQRLGNPNVWQTPGLVIAGATLLYASTWVAGRELRPEVPSPHPEAYLRVRMHFPLLVLAGQRGHQPRLNVPLAPPEPGDQFLGYTRRHLYGPDGPVPSTKRLVHGTGFIASALVALGAGPMIGSRRQAVQHYARQSGGHWADLLLAIQDYAIERWGYRVPADPVDQERLHKLCVSASAFENHFFATYQRWVVGELRYPDPAVRATALSELGRYQFADQELLVAIASAAGST